MNGSGWGAPPPPRREMLRGAGLSEAQCNILIGPDAEAAEGETAERAATDEAVRQVIEEVASAAVYKHLLSAALQREEALRAQVGDLRLQLRAALAASKLVRNVDSEYSELSERTVRQHTMIEILKDVIGIISDHSEPFEARPSYVPEAVDEDARHGHTSASGAERKGRGTEEDVRRKIEGDAAKDALLWL